MNNIKNDRYYIERILVDSKFIVEHMKDVEIIDHIDYTFI